MVYCKYQVHRLTMDSPQCNKPNVLDEYSMISKVNIFNVHNFQVIHACCH